MIRTIFLLLFFAMSVSLCYSQDFSLYNSIIKFDILKTSTQKVGGDTIIPSKYLIDVTIPEKQKKRYKSLSKKKWIKLLNNSKTDWAANLVLYDLYQKDAIDFFFIIVSREKWVLLQKKKDLDHWSKVLPNYPTTLLAHSMIKTK